MVSAGVAAVRARMGVAAAAIAISNTKNRHIFIILCGFTLQRYCFSANQRPIQPTLFHKNPQCAIRPQRCEMRLTPLNVDFFATFRGVGRAKAAFFGSQISFLSGFFEFSIGGCDTIRGDLRVLSQKRGVVANKKYFFAKKC